jgi:peptidoglycan-associated lipoprotein
MKIKVLTGLLLMAVLLIAGCASKGYVDTRVAEAESRRQQELDDLKSKAALNAEDIEKLKTLTQELSSKADMALNEAKGFEDYQVIWEGTVHFDFDSYEITQVAQETMDELGKKMLEYPRSLLEIEGHTDQSGPKKYNMVLGMDRATSVQNYLINNYGIGLFRMFTTSYGKSRPIALPDEKNAYSKNRRVELKLWGML